jgi:hypothetical protein
MDTYLHKFQCDMLVMYRSCTIGGHFGGLIGQPIIGGGVVECLTRTSYFRKSCRVGSNPCQGKAVVSASKKLDTHCFVLVGP